MQLLSLEQNNSSLALSKQWRIQGEGPGRPAAPPLFLDEIEARRAEKIWGKDQPSPLLI